MDGAIERPAPGPEALAAAGMTTVKGSTPESFAKVIDEELASYKKLASKVRGK